MATSRRQRAVSPLTPLEEDGRLTFTRETTGNDTPARSLEIRGKMSLRGLGRWLAHREQPAAPPREERGTARRIWTFISQSKDILVLIALVGAMHFIGRLHYFQSGQMQGVIQSFGVTAPLAFISLCALAVAAFVPPTLPIGIGSLAFGHARGAVFSLLGITAGACLAFLLGRHSLTTLVTRLKGRRFKSIDTWMEKPNKFPCMLSLRLIFFCDPTFNYLSGATRALTPGVYASATFLGLIPRTFMISYFFDLFLKATLRDMLTNPIVLSFPLLRLVGVLLLTVLVKHPGKQVV